MADLDDFFKKRDKKKKDGKSSSKFTKVNPEEYAKQLETINKSNHVDIEPGAGDLADESSYVIVDSANLAPAINEPLATLTISSNQSTTNANKESKESSSSKHNNAAEHNGDEEWKPFESDENKDYSGLKIVKLDKWNNDDEEEVDEESNVDQEKKPNCPWMKNKQQGHHVKFVEADTDIIDAQPKVEEKKPEEVQVKKEETPNPTNETTDEAPKSAGAYVPPHLRNKQASGTAAAAPAAPASGSDSTSGKPTGATGAYVPPHLRGSTTGSSAAPSSPESFTSVKKLGRNQPNINDIGEFPTLGIEAKGSNPDSKFEQPKRSSKVDSSSTKATGSIDIENRYNALSSS